jgi:hypothetical protein
MKKRIFAGVFALLLWVCLSVPALAAESPSRLVDDANLLTASQEQDLVEKLTIGDITVTIDLTGVENTAAVEAKITFPPKFSSLGAVGKYSVSVHVKPEEVTPVTEPEA